MYFFFLHVKSHSRVSRDSLGSFWALGYCERQHLLRSADVFTRWCSHGPDDGVLQRRWFAGKRVDIVQKEVILQYIHQSSGVAEKGPMWVCVLNSLENLESRGLVWFKGSFTCEISPNKMTKIPQKESPLWSLGPHAIAFFVHPLATPLVLTLRTRKQVFCQCLKQAVRHNPLAKVFRHFYG